MGINRDITARKRAEAKLAYEQELFQTLLETLPDNIYFKDRKSCFVRVSRSKVGGHTEPSATTIARQIRTPVRNNGLPIWPSV